ncbi:Phosphatidylglycerol/phosphatidylinositol transfer protein [Conoideocrella luteorostrata]|uniref:Phosphatidylglycerol/phosphatidylinositol transfer protein n=1 Tax=Conoideocrella luteorostrata TaxID=1105319 RepID=A0AAJ0D0S0_9HYPO|nr:Phosphatidylglycerol/phosphatidylinositol transfer protein [Conoideocrella luteorostrata]
MRVSAAVLSALVAPSAAALSFFNGGAQKAITLDEDLKIPGESPLEHCPDRETKGYVDIKSVDLSPNPPLAGKELVIKANGTVLKTIEQGAYIELIVKYGYVRLLKTTADLCEQMDEVNMECPVKPGDRLITKTVELPKEIPPGTYHVEADVFAANGDRITCLTANVQFSLPGFDVMDGEL